MSRSDGQHGGWEAPVAVSLLAEDFAHIRDKDRLLWSAWRYCHWPASVVQPGLRFYAFDSTRDAFVYLLEVTHGGAFTYRTREQFNRQVTKTTRVPPDPNDPYWTAKKAPPPGEDFHGIALRWRVLKAVNLPYTDRFPRIGWLRLQGVPLASRANSLVDAYEEGGRTLRQHMRVERNPALRRAAIHYWADQFGGQLRCLVCGFDFEATYGEFGTGIIEMHHHVRSVATLTAKEKLRPADLAPLCSNCHRVAHHRIPPVSVRQMRKVVEQHVPQGRGHRPPRRSKP